MEKDKFLEEIIPKEKDSKAVEKLWSSGKGIFKSRDEIFEDDD